MSAVLRQPLQRPIRAHLSLPEGTVIIEAEASQLNGTRCVHVIIDRGTKLPAIDLDLVPEEAARLALKLIKSASEARAAGG